MTKLIKQFKNSLNDLKNGRINQSNKEIESINKLCSKWYEMGKRSNNKKRRTKNKAWIKFEVCLKCKKEFKTKHKKQIFCSIRCQTQFNSLKRYHKLKNNKEFKRKNKEYFKKWINKNRKHFNDLCRESNKLNQRKRVAERKKKGLCLSCGKQLDDISFKSCSICRINNRKRYYNARLREVKNDRFRRTNNK